MLIREFWRIKTLTAMIFCSDTCEPIAKRRFNCFSMRQSISKSSSVVNPSAPAKLPVMAASSVDTWNKRRASLTCESVANGNNCIFANDSDIRITASSWLKLKHKICQYHCLYDFKCMIVVIPNGNWNRQSLVGCFFLLANASTHQNITALQFFTSFRTQTRATPCSAIVNVLFQNRQRYFSFFWFTCGFVCVQMNVNDMAS